ncbi:MAG: hypothetical protein ACYCOU_01515 [Sulfobacillus sp.]
MNELKEAIVASFPGDASSLDQLSRAEVEALCRKLTAEPFEEQGSQGRERRLEAKPRRPLSSATPRDQVKSLMFPSGEFRPEFLDYPFVDRVHRAYLEVLRLPDDKCPFVFASSYELYGMVPTLDLYLYLLEDDLIEWFADSKRAVDFPRSRPVAERRGNRCADPLFYRPPYSGKLDLPTGELNRLLDGLSSLQLASLCGGLRISYPGNDLTEVVRHRCRKSFAGTRAACYALSESLADVPFPESDDAAAVAFYVRVRQKYGFNAPPPKWAPDMTDYLKLKEAAPVQLIDFEYQLVEHAEWRERQTEQLLSFEPTLSQYVNYGYKRMNADCREGLINEHDLILMNAATLCSPTPADLSVTRVVYGGLPVELNRTYVTDSLTSTSMAILRRNYRLMLKSGTVFTFYVPKGTNCIYARVFGLSHEMELIFPPGLRYVLFEKDPEHEHYFGVLF